MKVVNVQGRKKTGKTTTVTNIIAELVRRGYSVGSVKSIHIDDFALDSETADTGKHRKAGADPVTARCHGETDIMFRGKMNLKEILKHYDNDWVVIESHVDLKCPNIVTGGTAEYSGSGKDVSLAEQVNDLTIACSGVVSNELSEFRGLPVVNSVTDVAALVDLIEAAYEKPPCLENNRETAEGFELIETNEFTRVFADGSSEEGKDFMLLENSVDMVVNGVHRGTVPCTPQNMTELVIGWLRAEGYVDSIQEIESIIINSEGNLADIKVRDYGAANGRKYDILPVVPMEWKKEWIFALAEDFENIMPLRRQTMAAHNCRIARIVADGPDEAGHIEILYRCEDIGRHSVIDKAIGWAMRNNVDLRECIIFTSGRISREMVRKVIRAGIPVMAGKGTISGEGVRLARENGLTLIGYGKPNSICVFTSNTVK